MVKRASFCILAALEVLQSPYIYLYGTGERKFPNILQGQENLAADQGQ